MKLTDKDAPERVLPISGRQRGAYGFSGSSAKKTSKRFLSPCRS